MSTIADRFDSSVVAIQRLNGLSNHRIIAGRTLIVPVVYAINAKTP